MQLLFKVYISPVGFIIFLFTTFAEYGTQREHRQQDMWSLLGSAPLVGEVTVHNTGISKVK